MDGSDFAGGECCNPDGVYDLDLQRRILAGERLSVFRGRPALVETVPAPAGYSGPESSSSPVFRLRRIRGASRQTALPSGSVWRPRRRFEFHPAHVGHGKYSDVTSDGRPCKVCREVHNEIIVCAAWVLRWPETRVCNYVQEAGNRASRQGGDYSGVKAKALGRLVRFFRREKGENDIEYLTRVYQAREVELSNGPVVAKGRRKRVGRAGKR